jgi:hypothetical protein
MSNILNLNQPTVGVGLQTYTLTIPSAGQYKAGVQVSVPQAVPIGSAAGSGFGLGAGAGGGTLGGFSLGGAAKVSAASAVKASLVNQGITYTAVAAGVSGNAIAIKLVDPGASSSLSISTVDDSIIITLANSGSAVTTTATALVAAINADVNASLLVVASGSGASALSALATTLLAGGLNAVVASGAGAVGQGFGLAADGYQQPPVDVHSNPQGAAIASSLVITVVNTTTSTTILTAPALNPSQSALEFKVGFQAATNDVITITYSSSAASDKILNGLQSITTIQQGF